MKRLLLLLGIAIFSLQGTAEAETRATASHVGDDSILGIKIAHEDFNGGVLSGGNRNGVICDYPGEVKAAKNRPGARPEAVGELRSAY